MTDRPLLRRAAAFAAVAAFVIGVVLALAAASGRQAWSAGAARLSPGSMPLSLDEAAAAHRWVPAAGERSAVGAVADGYVAAARRTPECAANRLRMVRSGPNKYALGRCRTEAPRADGFPRPQTRLLRESAFASQIADNTCVTRRCADAARAAGASWVLTGASTGVRPRTTAPCPRYKNVDFATDHASRADRLGRVIPAGRQVLWRYATRGGGWVMAHWSGGAPYSWAFIPRSCVADPPTWTQIALWKHEHRAAGRHRPTSGRRFRLLRRALPCASRLRCQALPRRPG